MCLIRLIVLKCTAAESPHLMSNPINSRIYIHSASNWIWGGSYYPDFIILTLEPTQTGKICPKIVSTEPSVTYIYPHSVSWFTWKSELHVAIYDNNFFPVCRILRNTKCSREVQKPLIALRRQKPWVVFYLSAEVAYLSVVATNVNRYSGAFKDYVHIIFITCCLVRHV